MLKLLFLSLGCFCGGLHADAQFDNKLKNYSVELADQTYSFKSHQVFSESFRNTSYEIAGSISYYCHFTSEGDENFVHIYEAREDKENAQSSLVSSTKLNIKDIDFENYELSFEEVFEEQTKKAAYLVLLRGKEEWSIHTKYQPSEDSDYLDTIPIYFKDAQSAEKFCQHLHNLLNP